MSPLRLTINGEERTFEEALTVEQLPGRIGIDPRKVAVERNLEMVAKSTYPRTPLADSDRLEIVHFIGGGAPDGAGADVLYGEAGYTLPLDLAPGDRVRLLKAGAYTATYASVGFDGFPSPAAYYIWGSGISAPVLITIRMP